MRGVFFETEEVYRNTCKRWFADYSNPWVVHEYSGTVNCYGISGTHRCFSKGWPCSHARRDHVTMYKWSSKENSNEGTTKSVSCPMSCLAIKQSDPTATSGVYAICPDGKLSRKISVYCDQTTSTTTPRKTATITTKPKLTSTWKPKPEPKPKLNPKLCPMEYGLCVKVTILTNIDMHADCNCMHSPLASHCTSCPA